MTRSPRVVHVMTFTRGGAGVAAMRIHRALKSAGCDSCVLTLGRSDQDHDENIHVFPQRFPRLLERLAARVGFPAVEHDRMMRRRDRLGLHGISFSWPWSDYDITSHPLIASADIVHMHWVAGFLDWPSFFAKNSKPVVWTLHDINPTVGGFHTTEDAPRALPAAIASDAELQQRKAKFLEPAKTVHVVTPSEWLGRLSSASLALRRFPHSVIRNPTEPSIYRSFDQAMARDVLGLPAAGRLLLSVAERAGDSRKGASLLKASLAHLATNARFTWAAVGDPSGLDPTTAIPLGVISDPRLMALAYSAADLFVTPSLAENLPNVVIESLSAGTPVVGFPVGGIPEMIANGVNGVLAAGVSHESLADAIMTADQTEFDPVGIREHALAEYDPPVIAASYLRVYESLLR